MTRLSAFWFKYLKDVIPELRTHFITLELPATLSDIADAALLRYRTTQVRRLKVFPIESIVRGYLAGSAWEEYSTGKCTVHGITMPSGMNISDRLPTPTWTPSTKAEQGQKDQNISPAAGA